MHSIIVGIVIVILLIVLIGLLVKFKLSGGLTLGGFKTYLSDVIPGADEFSNTSRHHDVLLSKYVSELEQYIPCLSKFGKAKIIDSNEILRLHIYRNILNLITCYNEHPEVRNMIKSRYYDKNTVIGGIAEAVVYLTGHNIRSLTKFSHNVIECKGLASGGSNVVFICKITSYTEKHHKISEIGEFALRILFNNYTDSAEHVAAIRSLMAHHDYSKYFITPVVSHVDFLNDYDYTGVKTCWYLFDSCAPLGGADQIDFNKYLDAEFNCLRLLHSEKLYYRDWKPENFMKVDPNTFKAKRLKLSENYVLSDIDFSHNTYEYTIKHDYISNLYSSKFSGSDFQKVMDNIVALLSWLIIANEKLTHNDNDACYSWYESNINNNLLNFLNRCEARNELVDSKKFYKAIKTYYTHDRIRKCFN